MRILLIGRGVVATIYGQVWQEAGHEVEFLVRPGRASGYGPQVRTDLLDARRSPLGRRVRTTMPTRLREDLAGDERDLVVLAVAHQSLAAAAADLASRVGRATVLVLGNLWDEPAAVLAPLPADQVVLGFPSAGGGFDADGVLHGALLRTVVLGSAGDRPSPREAALRSLLRQAGFSVRSEPDIRGWLWLHFAQDVGMHAQGLRHGGLVGLVGNRPGLRDAMATGAELLPVLQARGVDLRRHRGTVRMLRHPGPTSVAMAWATRHVPLAQISLTAHTDPRAAEPSAVLRDAVREARRLGVATPRLDAAVRELDAAG
ncbi:MAG TPA: 2-dehydropantoate 2-reductase N-terminal domain-containing protein [Cellulomonas sp.]